MMTVVAIMAGLIPIMWSTGTGSEVMQRIAVPMIGGMISSTILTLVVIPAVYALIKGFGLPREPNAAVPVERGAKAQTTTTAFDRSQAAE
jgi:Cu(I)/Ag(I) efflux system membrane protein CusA/SilA